MGDVRESPIVLDRDVRAAIDSYLARRTLALVAMASTLFAAVGWGVGYFGRHVGEVTGAQKAYDEALPYLMKASADATAAGTVAKQATKTATESAQQATESLQAVVATQRKLQRFVVGTADSLATLLKSDPEFVQAILETRGEIGKDVSGVQKRIGQVEAQLEGVLRYGDEVSLQNDVQGRSNVWLAVTDPSDPDQITMRGPARAVHPFRSWRVVRAP